MFLTSQIIKQLPKTLLRLNNVDVNCKYLNFHTTTTTFTFWEKDAKGGYNRDLPKLSAKQLIRDGLVQMKKEIQLWKDEIVDKFEADPLLFLNPGEVEKLWKFSSEKDLEKWIVTTDKDHNEGETTGSLTINNRGKGVFSGVLSSKVPKDGIVKRSGYCNMRTERYKRSFQRNAYYDWGMFTHITLRVRGDGRSYFINLATSGFYDQQWNDCYHYIIFTRGGPYWQVVRIPFSRFYFTSKGRIQDLQFPIPLNRITNLGISVADKANGPFNLEIDYIGLEMDFTHKEEFAYEKYKVAKGIAAT